MLVHAKRERAAAPVHFQHSAETEQLVTELSGLEGTLGILSNLLFLPLDPKWVGCTEPLDSSFAFLRDIRHPSGAVTVPCCTSGAQVLCECVVFFLRKLNPPWRFPGSSDLSVDKPGLSGQYRVWLNDCFCLGTLLEFESSENYAGENQRNAFFKLLQELTLVADSCWAVQALFCRGAPGCCWQKRQQRGVVL